MYVIIPVTASLQFQSGKKPINTSSPNSVFQHFTCVVLLVGISP